MKFCQTHWDKMRAAIEARGMTPLVASHGNAAIQNIADEIKHGQTIDNFDPLMAMHWNISGNLLELLGQAAGYLLSCREGEEDPIDVSKLQDRPELAAKFLGKKWPLCPICYANIAHEITCSEERCSLDRVNGYDVCIEWSADGVRQTLDELMARKQ
jgi:hypothetical protein